MVETQGLLVGLALARVRGFQCVQIEGDSLVIINGFINREAHN